jgi:hypothetical protein
MKRLISRSFTSATVFFSMTLAALAQYEISWSTIDGGGQMNSSGGTYLLSGTIGQADAQSPPVMSGGSYELTGGFWPVTQVCYCPGDLTGDGKKDGRDIQLFVACVMSGGNCSCADVDAMNGVTPADTALFVADLLSGASCP